MCRFSFFSKTDHHDYVIKWKHFPRNWPFVRGIHRSPANSPHKEPATPKMLSFDDVIMTKQLSFVVFMCLSCESFRGCHTEWNKAIRRTLVLPPHTKSKFIPHLAGNQ